jgi:hypothetical protein
MPVWLFIIPGRLSYSVNRRCAIAGSTAKHRTINIVVKMLYFMVQSKEKEMEIPCRRRWFAESGVKVSANNPLITPAFRQQKNRKSKTIMTGVTVQTDRNSNKQ